MLSNQNPAGTKLGIVSVRVPTESKANTVTDRRLQTYSHKIAEDAKEYLLLHLTKLFRGF